MFSYFSGVTESSPLWTNTVEVERYFFIDFLKVNGSLIKIEILVSVVKYTFTKVKLECQEMKWLCSTSCLLVCASLGSGMCLTAYNYSNTCRTRECWAGTTRRMNFIKRLHCSFGLLHLCSLCRSFLVSQTLTYLLEVIAPLSLSTASRNKL